MASGRPLPPLPPAIQSPIGGSVRMRAPAGSSGSIVSLPGGAKLHPATLHSAPGAAATSSPFAVNSGLLRNLASEAARLLPARPLAAQAPAVPFSQGSLSSLSPDWTRPATGVGVAAAPAASHFTSSSSASPQSNVFPKSHPRIGPPPSKRTSRAAAGAKSVHLNASSQAVSTPDSTGRLVPSSVQALPPAAGAPVPPPPGARILGQRVIEREVRVPKLVRTEETVERLETRNETRRVEEIVEASQVVRERVRGVQRPVVREKIVEVPEIEYRDLPPREIITVIERPEITIEERLVEVPKRVERRRVIEVPEIEFRDQLVERTVAVPDIREEVRIVEKKIPQLVQREEVEVREVEQPVRVTRCIPVPTECVTHVDFHLPELEAQPEEISMPIFVPRFIEVPCPVENLTEEGVKEVEQYAKQIEALVHGPPVGIGEIDVLARKILALTAEDREAPAPIFHPDPGEKTAEMWATQQYEIDNLEMLQVELT